MSVQNEIQRINSAKANIKLTIELNGIAVPEDTKIDGYSELLGQVLGNYNSLIDSINGEVI